MTALPPRSGIFATLDAREYEANSYPQDGKVTLFSREQQNPDPELFDWNDVFGVWLATVDVAKCDRLFEVTTVAEYNGHTCQVTGIDADGNVGLYFLDSQRLGLPEMSALPEEGFVQIDAGTWAKTVNIYDLNRLMERHRDLLFDDWARRQVQEQA